MQPGANVSAPYKKLGAWLSRAYNTIYQAVSDGFVIGFHDLGNTDAGALVLDTDGSTPPTTTRTKSATTDSDSYLNMAYNFCAPVRKGDYWEVTKTGTMSNVTIWWIPLEP